MGHSPARSGLDVKTVRGFQMLIWYRPEVLLRITLEVTFAGHLLLTRLKPENEAVGMVFTDVGTAAPE